MRTKVSQLYKVKDNVMLEPFRAVDDEIAAGKALHLLGHSYGAKDIIEEMGTMESLKFLGYELEIVPE
jgi:hypothetical protein